MPTAVLCAAFDAHANDAIAAVRGRVRVLGARSPVDPAHRPHLALTATVVTEADVDDVVQLAAGVAARHESFPLVLDHVATFAHGSLIWLGPSRSDELAAVQCDAHDALIAAGRAPAFPDQSDPRRWVAHCTLARRADRKVAQALREHFEPITVNVTAVATILVGGHGDLALAALRPRP